LYDDSTQDTGPAPATDSLDDRFASVSDTMATRPAASVPAPPPSSTATPEPPPSPVPGTALAPTPAQGTGFATGTGTGTGLERLERLQRVERLEGCEGREGREGLVPAQRAPGPPESAPPEAGPPGAGWPQTRPSEAGPPGAGSAEAGPPSQRESWEPPPTVPQPPSAFTPARSDPSGLAGGALPPVQGYAPVAGAAWGPGPDTAGPDGASPLSPPVADGVTGTGAGPGNAGLGVRGAAEYAGFGPPAHHAEYVGSGPPTYDAEPTALPPADPDKLGEPGELVADTVLDGARYGTCTLRAVSVRGDSARYRGERRRDALLTARFGAGDRALILVAMATGARGAPGAHRAAAEACRWIGRAVGHSHQRLTDDIHAARRDALKSGLHRLTDRSLGRLRADATEQGIDPQEYAADLCCLLLPAHPGCRTRVFFGIGAGGLFRLRDGAWQDIEPQVGATGAGGAAGAPGDAGLGPRAVPPDRTPDGDRFTKDLGIPVPPSPYEPAPEPPREPFRFRACVARPGDALLMCSGGLADPLRGEPALRSHLARRWSEGLAPGLAEFLVDTQVRVKGYADDRTAAAVWEA
jgi:protein phosphatase 2C-like protein